jgi:hypothetical protein
VTENELYSLLGFQYSDVKAMHSLTFTSDHAQNWKILYRAAIQEPDRTRIPQLISAAEQAVIARGRELFHSPDKFEERDDLEDALYALRAFRSASGHLEEAE